MKICNKCKCELEENLKGGINQQNIELFGIPLDLCNSCSDKVLKFITGKEAQTFFDGDTALLEEYNIGDF